MPRRNILVASSWRFALAGVALCLPAIARGQVPPQDKPWSYAGPQGDAAMLKRHEVLLERVRKNKDAQLVFIGDSLTEFWETTGKEVWELKYARRKALNLGVSGDRTMGCLWRLEAGELEGLRAKMIVILNGTNNTLGDEVSVEDNVRGIKAVVAKVGQKQPQAQILLLGLLPRQDANSNGKWKLVNDRLREEKFDDAVHFLDIGRKFLDSDGKIVRGFSDDKFHLSAEGYRIWAEAIEPYVALTLNERRRPGGN